ncbi:hypothetical protein TI03_00505 [Achromatium sp. WMS1]|nr:hypothetical protein TI03_00505 [Achromatium sp. WMS1]
MSILGINCVYHESAACLIQDGKLIAAAEEERFTRKKHAKPARVDNADELPENAIAFCLEYGGLSDISEVDFIGYSLDPEERFYKNTHYRSGYNIPVGDYGTLEGERQFYQSNINVERKIRAKGYHGRFFYLDHHDCHAASIFYVSGYHDSAIIVLDGIAEFESSSFLKGEGIRFRRIRYDSFPNSIGFLWEKMSVFFGFTEYDAAKVMGLSSYGQLGVFKEAMDQLVRVDDRGHFIINDSVMQLRNNNFEHIEAVFGVPKCNEPITEVDSNTQVYANIALALQSVTEEIVVKLARQLRKETMSEHLCMAGGVTLNCVANGKLAYAQILKNFYVQPAAHDAGTAIGAAYLIWHHKLGYPRQPITKSPYLGPEYSNEQIQVVLDKYGLKYRYHEDIEVVTAQCLVKGNIVAWFQGRMEIGPRALGNRSLLVDPRLTTVRELMNRKVKHREPFRPFCPSVLAEKAADWFELPNPIPDVANYMLGAFRANEEKAHLIPAVVHIDGTSRIQTVHKDTNPRFHRLLTEMELHTGIPILLNTSFNVQEPIVCSPEDAVKTFLRTHINNLAIGNYLVTKN